MTKQATTIYCHCAYYQFIPEKRKEKVFNALKSSGTEFEAVADLCQMCARRDPELRRWAQPKSIRIIACYPRAVKWLFYAAGASLPETGVEFLNMRGDGTKKIVSSLTGTSVGKSRRRAPLEVDGLLLTGLEKTGDWVPWFPVIDYDRCKNCRQCLDFCLFGVYELSEQDRVEVRKPANCKTNCPACARACPHSAIIFPKYSNSPINGDEVTEQAQQAQEMKMDMSKLSDVDVYDAIRRRSKGLSRLGRAKTGGKRFSKKTEHEAGTVPTNWSGSFLKELQEKLDIPTDVLASLSPAEMADIKNNMNKQGRVNTQQSTSSELAPASGDESRGNGEERKHDE